MRRRSTITAVSVGISAPRQFTITTRQGRLKGIPFLSSPEALTTLAAYRKGEADLLHCAGAWYLVATCAIPEPQIYEPDGFIGVGIGIENMVTSGPSPSSEPSPSTRPSGRICRSSATTLPARRRCAANASTSTSAAVSIRAFQLPGCGVVPHSDRNASHNIAQWGETV